MFIKEKNIHVPLVLIMFAASVSANASVPETPTLDTKQTNPPVCLNLSATLRMSIDSHNPNFNCLGRCGKVAFGPNLCSCDVRCHFANTCCEGFSQVCPRVSVDGKAFAASVMTSMGSASQDIFDTSGNYMLVRRCPENWTDPNIRVLCESHTNFTENIETAIPVFGYGKKLHYYNKYCALCHSESAWQPWKSTILCDGAIANVTTDVQNLFIQLSALGCIVKDHQRIEESGLFNASELPHSVPTIKYRNQCNEHCRSSKLSALCDASLFPVVCYSEEKQQHVRYRNQFCVICSGDNVVTESCQNLIAGGGFGDRPISLVFFFSLRRNNANILVLSEPSKKDCTSPHKPCVTEAKPSESSSLLRQTTHLLSPFSESAKRVLQVKMRSKHPLPVDQMEALMQNVTNSLVEEKLFDTANNSSWLASSGNILDKRVRCFQNITNGTSAATKDQKGHSYYLYLLSPVLVDVNSKWFFPDRLDTFQSKLFLTLTNDFEVLAVRFEANFQSNISSCPSSTEVSDFKGDGKPPFSTPEVVMSYITVVILILSILCLVGRIILQIVPSKALNMGDQLQIVLVILLLMFYVSFLIAALVYSLLEDKYVIVRVCSIIALWALLSYFSSTNALGAHLFKVICLPLETRRLSVTRHWRDFLIYSLLPGTVITLLATILEFIWVPEEWNPFFGACGPSICQIRPKIVFLVIPFGLMMLLNLIFLSLIMRKLRKSTNGLTRQKNDCHGEHYSRQLYVISFRLFITMGLAWIIAFVNIFFSEVILDTISTLILGSMGIILLVTFICRSSTLKCLGTKQSKPRDSIMKTLGRTLSNQNFASTVSVYSHRGRES